MLQTGYSYTHGQGARVTYAGGTGARVAINVKSLKRDLSTVDIWEC